MSRHTSAGEQPSREQKTERRTARRYPVAWRVALNGAEEFTRDISAAGLYLELPESDFSVG